MNKINQLSVIYVVFIIIIWMTEHYIFNVKLLLVNNN